jgi:hypothetical protein
MRRYFKVSTVIALLVLSCGLAACESDEKDRDIVARLSGGQVVPKDGDPDGTGTARFDLDEDEDKICYTLTWNNIEKPTEAHIHKGQRGVEGRTVVKLFDDPQSGNSKSDCVDDVSKDLIEDILENPEQYYVSIHNKVYPDGALRGQLEEEEKHH